MSRGPLPAPRAPLHRAHDLPRGDRLNNAHADLIACCDDQRRAAASGQRARLASGSASSSTARTSRWRASASVALAAAVVAIAAAAAAGVVAAAPVAVAAAVARVRLVLPRRASWQSRELVSCLAAFRAESTSPAPRRARVSELPCCFPLSSRSGRLSEPVAAVLPASCVWQVKRYWPGWCAWGGAGEGGGSWRSLYRRSLGRALARHSLARRSLARPGARSARRSGARSAGRSGARSARARSAGRCK
jgi:hypothetical protein